MFAKLLPNDINVYAITATKPGELGWKAESDHGTYDTWVGTYLIKVYNNFSMVNQ